MTLTAPALDPTTGRPTTGSPTAGGPASGDARRKLAVGRRSRAVTVLPAAALAVDIVAIAASLAAATALRWKISFFDGPLVASWPLLIAAPFIMAVWLTGLLLTGTYRFGSFGVGADEYKRLANGTMGAAAFVGITCYLADWSLSRGFFALAFVVGFPALLLARSLVRVVVHHARAQGRWTHRVLIMGSPGHVDEITRVLHREPWLGYRVVGALVPGGATGPRPTAAEVLGAPEQAGLMAELVGADILLVGEGAFDSSLDVRRLAWDLEHHDVEVVVVPGLTDVAAERVRIRPVCGLPLIHLERPTTIKATRKMKRVFDAVVAWCVLAALSPLVVAIAIWIKLHDGGPVLFRQERIGRDGIAFECLKFRSMRIDAESMLERLRREHDITTGLFKLKDDPRVTGPGKVLRRYSLDEIPQLVNILLGDMSLVGPRPPLPREADEYDDIALRRLRVRPGLTGLWQVSGRSDLAYEEAVRLDLYYVDNWSMIQDLSILRRTVKAVLASKGAY